MKRFFWFMVVLVVFASACFGACDNVVLDPNEIPFPVLAQYGIGAWKQIEIGIEHSGIVRGCDPLGCQAMDCLPVDFPEGATLEAWTSSNPCEQQWLWRWTPTQTGLFLLVVDVVTIDPYDLSGRSTVRALAIIVYDPSRPPPQVDFLDFDNPVTQHFMHQFGKRWLEL